MPQRGVYEQQSKRVTAGAAESGDAQRLMGPAACLASIDDQIKPNGNGAVTQTLQQVPLPSGAEPWVEEENYDHRG